MARGLSQERLARLVRDVRALPEYQRFDSDSGIPDAFKDLNPRFIQFRSNHAIINLSGCYDDKATLLVEQHLASGTWRVKLAPGEGETPVLLWQSN